MTDKNALRDLLHEVTHRVPGVPGHVERAAGHQGGVGVAGSGAPAHAAQPTRHHAATPHHHNLHASVNRHRNHSSNRPPRFLPAWQRRIAAFFSREL